MEASGAHQLEIKVVSDQTFVSLLRAHCQSLHSIKVHPIRPVLHFTPKQASRRILLVTLRRTRLTNPPMSLHHQVLLVERAACRGRRSAGQMIKPYPRTLTTTKSQEVYQPGSVVTSARLCENDLNPAHRQDPSPSLDRPAQDRSRWLSRISVGEDPNLPFLLRKPALRDLLFEDHQKYNKGIMSDTNHRSAPSLPVYLLNPSLLPIVSCSNISFLQKRLLSDGFLAPN